VIDYWTGPVLPAMTLSPSTWMPLVALAVIVAGVAVGMLVLAWRSRRRIADPAPEPAPPGYFHPPRRCIPPCPIHAPSDHHMADWDKQYRLRGIFERICPEHRTGHPDPDSMAYLRDHVGLREDKLATLAMHGCCGCCVVPANSGGETESAVP